MELVRTGDREVEFFLDIDFLSQYELNFETFEKRKPFKAKIVDDLLNLANEKYGLDFDESDAPKVIYFAEDCVVMVFEKRDQNYLESEKNEELRIMKSIRELFCFCRTKKYTLRKWRLRKKESC